MCEKITARRSAFSYLDVARAYVLLAFLENSDCAAVGVDKAFEVGERLLIGHSTIDNWFKRDLARWIDRMDEAERSSDEEEKAKAIRGKKHYSMTPEQLRWIARVRLECSGSPNLRQFARIVRDKALSEKGMRDLSRISPSTLWRMSAEIDRLVQELKAQYSSSTEAAWLALQNRRSAQRTSPEPAPTLSAGETEDEGDPF